MRLISCKKFTLDVRYVKNFFGLGFGLESGGICDDVGGNKRTAYTNKVFLGPIIFGLFFDLKKKKK